MLKLSPLRPKIALPSPIQTIQHQVFTQKGLQLFIKRDDLLHTEVSGNKWRKLQYNLVAALEQQATALLTFGGAFSNHILAVAAASHQLQLPSYGIIRGEPKAQSNPTLSRAQALGMQLHFVDRSAYRDKPKLLDQFSFGKKVFVIPEGGSNLMALKGCHAIVSEVGQQLSRTPDYWCCSVGTGGTIAGVIQALGGKAKVIGFSALKGQFLTKTVHDLLATAAKNVPANWHINTDYHFGGYAKWQPELIDFINHFKREHAIPLDPIYTGKLLYGIVDLAKKDYFPTGSQILVVHTGGLQGIKGFNERFGSLIEED